MGRVKQNAKRSSGGRAPIRKLATKSARSQRQGGPSKKELRDIAAQKKLEFKEFCEVPSELENLSQFFEEQATTDTTEVRTPSKKRSAASSATPPGAPQKEDSVKKPLASSSAKKRKLSTTINRSAPKATADSEKKPAAKMGKRNKSPAKNPQSKKAKEMDQASKKDSSSPPPAPRTPSKARKGGRGSQAKKASLPLHKKTSDEPVDVSPPITDPPIARRDLPPSRSLVKSIEVAGKKEESKIVDKDPPAPSPPDDKSVPEPKKVDASNNQESKESEDTLEKKVAEEEKGEDAPPATEDGDGGDQNDTSLVPGRVTPPIPEVGETVVTLDLQKDVEKPTLDTQEASRQLGDLSEAPNEDLSQAVSLLNLSTTSEEVKDAEVYNADDEVLPDASEQRSLIEDLEDNNAETQLIPTATLAEASSEAAQSPLPMDVDASSKAVGTSQDTPMSEVEASQEDSADAEMTPTPDAQEGLTTAAELPSRKDDESLNVAAGSGSSSLREVKASEEGSVDEHLAETQVTSHVSAAVPLVETEDELKSRLLEAFNEYLEELKPHVDEVIPNINQLPPEAIRFLTSIFGGDDLLPATNAVENLVSFLPIATSSKLASFAHQKMKDDTFQFQLRYFAGGASSDGSPDSLKEAEFIKTFLQSIFNEPEHEPINQCVECARTLYITAKKLQYSQKAPPGEPRHFSDVENIVSCINFALLGTNRGFFVNWLATSKETISTKMYGDDFSPLIISNQSWYRHHFATFLIKAVNFAVVTHLHMHNQLYGSHYNIVLQARVSNRESSDKLYSQIGFQEMGYMQSESDLKEYVFPEFHGILDNAKYSTTDFMHFIWDAPDIFVFKNNTGKFGKVKSFSGDYQYSWSYKPIHKRDLMKGFLFDFPFLIQRRNIILLSTELEFFCLPFKLGADYDEFMRGNMNFHRGHGISITENFKEIMRSPTAWLNSGCINFFIAW